jgi:hypothetical protein
MSNIDNLDKEKVYYLASPYTSPDLEKMKERYLKVDEVGYKLLMKGFHIIEPIASTYHKAQRFQLPHDYSFWINHCRKFVEISDSVIVLMLDDWENSVGVQDEIKIATELGKKVVYISENEL